MAKNTRKFSRQERKAYTYSLGGSFQRWIEIEADKFIENNLHIEPAEFGMSLFSVMQSWEQSIIEEFFRVTIKKSKEA